MLGRDGNVSVVRVGTIAAVVGVLFIVGAIAAFFLDRASHQQPLEVQAYPGAADAGRIDRSDISRTVFFQVAGITPEEVVAYYQQKMDEFYGSGTEIELRGCKRFPSSGNQFEFDRGDAGVVPYQFTCLFDRSGFFASQFTRVTIQPGIGDNEGFTMISHDQTWQTG